MADHPYRPPMASLGPPGAPGDAVRRRAAQLSGAGLAALTVGGMLSLVLLGGPLLVLRAAETASPTLRAAFVVAGLTCAVVLFGGLALWRLRPEARYLVVPMVLVSLPLLPLGPLVAGTVAWAVWTGPGPAALRTRPAPALTPREVLPWFFATGALLGIGQPAVFVIAAIALG